MTRTTTHELLIEMMSFVPVLGDAIVERRLGQLLPLRALYRDRHEKSLLTLDFIFLCRLRQRLPAWESLWIVRPL